MGAYDIDLAHYLKPGRNVIAVRCVDKDKGQTALMAQLAVADRSGAQCCWSTAENDWRSAIRQVPSEWAEVWFDDRAWPLAQPAQESLVLEKTAR